MAPVVSWVCSKCGRTTSASKKPGTNGTSYGKCPKGGEHNWKRK